MTINKHIFLLSLHSQVHTSYPTLINILHILHTEAYKNKCLKATQFYNINKTTCLNAKQITINLRTNLHEKQNTSCVTLQM